MSERIHVLTHELFGKSSLDDVTLSDAQTLVRRFPYFSPAQFLLLEKLRLEGTQEEYEQQLRKAVLYYPDPLAFSFVINGNEFPADAELNDLPQSDQIQMSTLNDSSLGAEPAVQVEVAVPVQTEVALSDDMSAVEGGTESKGEAAAVESVEPLEIRPVFQPMASPGNGINPADSAITFEPFHTVDYFASQGIKLSQEDAGKDKFGKQLKSFTEWLRTMKRLPATEAVPSLDSPSERKVTTLAEHSVDRADVVTEAMAEVWIKQGNLAKAIDVYNELSLLNPSKNAYFATKIQNLKDS
jgi:hypothetical protein